jgi:hypothetical protein
VEALRAELAEALREVSALRAAEAGAEARAASEAGEAAVRAEEAEGLRRGLAAAAAAEELEVSFSESEVAAASSGGAEGALREQLDRMEVEVCCGAWTRAILGHFGSSPGMLNDLRPTCVGIAAAGARCRRL